MAKKQQVSLHITPEIYKQAKEKAKSQGLTTNVYIEQLVRKDLGK
ncbi:hypothetical protein ACDN41_26855 [Priestia aryabhattai]